MPLLRRKEFQSAEQGYGRYYEVKGKALSKVRKAMRKRKGRYYIQCLILHRSFCFCSICLHARN